MLAAFHFTALTRPRLVAGIGLKSSIMIWGASLIVTLMVGFPVAAIAVSLSLIAHVALFWAFRKDDRILEVLKAYELLSLNYAGASFWSDSGLLSRPKGFGKGLPC